MPPRPLSLRDRRVFVDTSAYQALLDEDDDFHDEAVILVTYLAREHYRQFTTNILLIESHAHKDEEGRG